MVGPATGVFGESAAELRIDEHQHARCFARSVEICEECSQRAAKLLEQSRVGADLIEVRIKAAQAGCSRWRWSTPL